jgi:uncharacterized membrane protein
VPELIVLVSTVLYAIVGIVSHLSLRTNAFDLSMFDYALWNSLNGRLGWIPFVGHSICSEHFMPILLLILPVYAVSQSPVTLILIQTLSVGIAVLLLVRLAKVERIDSLATCVVVVVFLLSRPTFHAVNSFFYPEAFQPTLVVSSILAWRRSRIRLYWVCLALLLMTKEDAAVYVAMFGAVRYVVEPTRRVESLLTIALATFWLAIAVGVAIPFSRSLDGMRDASHFVTVRYGGSDDSLRLADLVRRLISAHAGLTAITLVVTFGLLPLLAPEWLAVISAGFVMNIVARPDTLQAAFAGHYYWAVLPWLAVAALVGSRRLGDAAPRTAVAICVILTLATIASSPLLRKRYFVIDPAARQIRAQIPDTSGLIVAAQPNLVPHIPHDNRITTLGREFDARAIYDFVLLTTVGDTWPFSVDEVTTVARRYGTDPAWRRVGSGPLLAFQRTK